MSKILFENGTVVLGEGLSWQTALGAVFISGIVFVILTVTGIRELLMDGVPTVMKYSIGAGIGLFIAFIGLQNAGLVVADDVIVLFVLWEATTVFSYLLIGHDAVKRASRAAASGKRAPSIAVGRPA